MRLFRNHRSRAFFRPALSCVFSVLTASSSSSSSASALDFGADVSYPIHHRSLLPASSNPLGDKQRAYDDMVGRCKAKFGDECDVSEEDRIKMNREQPPNVVNLTDTGYKKLRCPENAFSLLRDFWDRNKDRGEPELWGRGDMTCNHWEASQHMVSLENTSLRGGGEDIKREVWGAAEEVITEWVGEELRACSLYGIRVYREGSVLSPHVDRFPLVSSAIVNVAQDVDEPWPLEVYGRDGRAVNITMEPGDMVLYESHSLIHGRPFPLKGKFMANVFIHFEPKRIREDGFPIYLMPDAPRSLVDTWRVQVDENEGEGEEERQGRSEDLDEYDDGGTEAHFAAARGDITALQEIASDSKEDLHSADLNGWKPIHEAARAGQKEAIEFLLESGADINDRTDFGKGHSPLGLVISEYGEDHPMAHFLESIGGLDVGPEL